MTQGLRRTLIAACICVGAAGCITLDSAHTSAIAVSCLSYSDKVARATELLKSRRMSAQEGTRIASVNEQVKPVCSQKGNMTGVGALATVREGNLALGAILAPYTGGK